MGFGKAAVKEVYHGARRDDKCRLLVDLGLAKLVSRLVEVVGEWARPQVDQN